MIKILLAHGAELRMHQTPMPRSEEAGETNETKKCTLDSVLQTDGIT
jgi:hypothetical protein